MRGEIDNEVIEVKNEQIYEDVECFVQYFIQRFLEKFGNAKVKTFDNKITITTKLPKLIKNAVIRIKHYEEKVRTVVDIWDSNLKNPFTFHIDMEEKILVTAKNARKVSTDYNHEEDCTVIYITTSITKIKAIIDLNAFEHMQPFIFLVFS